MAPQILQRKTYSTKCDIWSLGVIFYEAVFKCVPWTGRDEQDLLKNILIKPLVFKGNCTEFTREFLTKALMVEESERISWD
jgi:calcium-dependent protein kinase